MSTHTLIHFSPDCNDVRTDGYDNLDLALDAAGRIDPARLVYLSVEDAGAPNGMRVSRVDRTESGDAIYVDPTSPQVTTLHNALAERPVARFATRTAAIEKTTRLLSARLGEQKESEKVEAQVAERTEAPKGRGGRKRTHTDDMVVVLKVARNERNLPMNPKREGSATHGRFAAMVRAMGAEGRCTVAQAIAVGVTRGDLAYDEAHGYVEIVKA